MSGGAGGPNADEAPRAGRRPRPQPERGRAHRTARGVGAAWRSLAPDQKLAAIAAIALLLSMFLPWYRVTGTVVVNGRAQPNPPASLTAFEVYSFVEAAVFVVSIGVLALLYARGNRKAFHLPGGDGAVIIAAGFWVMFLVFYRQFDRPERPDPRVISGNVSVNWGIFIAFVLGGVLAYTGFRIRASHTPEPVVDDAPPPTADGGAGATQGRPPAAPWLDEDDDAAPPTTERTTVAQPQPQPQPQPPRPRRTAEGPAVEGELDVDEPAEYRPPPRKR